MNELSNEILLMIVINLLTVAFFAGVFFQTQKQLKDAILQIESQFSKKVQELKDDFQEKIIDLKYDFQEKITDLKNNFHEKFIRVEQKQDKHNNLIERMALCEASTKSAHKREDDLTERVKVLEEEYYEHITKRN